MSFQIFHSTLSVKRRTVNLDAGCSAAAVLAQTPSVPYDGTSPMALEVWFVGKVGISVAPSSAIGKSERTPALSGQ